MPMEYLKRLLPFTLTFIIGAGLGGFVGLFKSDKVEKNSRSYLTTRDFGRGCSSRKRAWVGRYEMPGADGPQAQGRVNVVATQSFPSDSRMFVQESSPQPVRIFRTPAPLYTRSARRNGTQGVVRLSVIFGADGQTKIEQVVSALPDGLTEQATEAVRRIEFTPATLGGEPVSTHGVVDCVFELLAEKRL